MASATSRYYKKNPKALAKKRATNRKWMKENYGSEAPNGPKKRRKNSEGNRRWAERKKRGIAGKGGPDVSHKSDGKLTLEKRSTNRARNGKNGKSTKKPTRRKK